MTLLLAGIACVVLVLLVLPLLRDAQPVAERAHFDRVVYRDQLQELDRDSARGLLTETEITSARLEIQRRLLASDSVPGETAGPGGRSPVLASFVALFAAAGAVAVYVVLGAPAIPDTPFLSHTAVANDTPSDAAQPTGQDDVPAQHDLAQALDALAAKLKIDPANADGWLLYARAAGSMRRWGEAADAYRHVLALGQTGADIQSGYAEMLTLQADGIVTPAARDALVASLKDDPANDVARYYLGLAAGQAGEPEQAIREFQTLLADIPKDSPMREEIGKRIGEAAKAAGLPVPGLAKGTPPEVPDPGQAAMEAASVLPQGAQNDMIAGMVAKLAARMQTERGDVDGWMRLGRAYAVMGDREKGADAYQQAAALKPGDVGIRLQAVEGLLTGLKPDDALPPGALALLHQVEATAPEEPEVLWYLGIAAARDAHPADAKRYWDRLLAKLPAEGKDARMVKGARDSLKGG